MVIKSTVGTNSWQIEIVFQKKERHQGNALATPMQFQNNAQRFRAPYLGISGLDITARGC